MVRILRPRSTTRLRCGRSRMRSVSDTKVNQWQSPGGDFLLLIDRGTCNFVKKVRNAEEAGAGVSLSQITNVLQEIPSATVMITLIPLEVRGSSAKREISIISRCHVSITSLESQEWSPASLTHTTENHSKINVRMHTECYENLTRASRSKRYEYDQSRNLREPATGTRTHMSGWPVSDGYVSSIHGKRWKW